jgi:membrane dipeptidase
VVQVTFGSAFLSQAANDWNDGLKAARTAAKVADSGPEADAFEKTYRESHPYPYASVETLADHIDYLVKRVGIDHVGLGSDFDGVGDSLPIGLKDVSQYPNLIAELLRRGYGKAQIAQIAGGNLLRVWAAVDAYAAAHAGG